MSGFDFDTPMGRRQALKLGGLTVSLAALAAACGSDRGGDTAPGRVGNAPSITALAEYEVNNVVLLRTASSVELSLVSVYESAMAMGALPGNISDLANQIVANHRATADEMGALTTAAGGTAWNSTNPWMMHRSIEPILATISDSDDPERDMVNFLITLENVASATHQNLTALLSESDQRLAAAHAATREARNSASLVLGALGTAHRISPTLLGDEAVETDGTIPRYAIETTFGSVAQEELRVGAADENGNRASYLLATPADNSYIYSELEDA